MLLYFLLCTFWQYISIHWYPLYLSLMSKVEVLSFFWLNKCLILKISSILLKKKGARLSTEKQPIKIISFKGENNGYLIYLWSDEAFKGTWSNKTLDKWRLEITLTVPLNSLLFYFSWLLRFSNINEDAPYKKGNEILRLFMKRKLMLRAKTWRKNRKHYLLKDDSTEEPKLIQ